MSEVTVYDVAEPITAYRAWMLVPNPQVGSRHALGAVTFKTIWKRVMHAQPCLSTNLGETRCDGPPCSGTNPRGVGHGCGIYAMKSFVDTVISLGAGTVVGRVLLAGKVWPHSKGYRASKARIDALYATSVFTPLARLLENRPPYPNAADMNELADWYGVPLIEPTDSEKEHLQIAAETQWIAYKLGAVVLT